LAPAIDGDGMQRRFMGIWSKNRAEWMTTLLACMRVDTTVVGFFDAMGAEAVDFIIKQTELETIFASGEYIKKIIEFKNEGYCKCIKNIINFDNDTTNEMTTKASEVGLTITAWSFAINDKGEERKL
jgi:long-chain acyl-CoA synthetase